MSGTWIFGNPLGPILDIRVIPISRFIDQVDEWLDCRKLTVEVVAYRVDRVPHIILIVDRPVPSAVAPIGVERQPLRNARSVIAFFWSEETAIEALFHTDFR